MAHMNVGFFSGALGMCVNCSVIMPQATLQKPLGARKTLYLLHGAYGGNEDWPRLTNIERYAARYDLAVVMPDAHMSGYCDMAHGGKFFTYIADELPQIMRSFFPLSDKREDTFIAGLSMGGAGSLKIAFARPEQYAAVGCLSAGAFNKTNDVTGMRVLRTGGRALDGTEEDVLENARRIAEKGAPNLRVFHAIGTEDFLLESARETRDFIKALPGNALDYTYIEHPGAHTWDFWDAHIQQFLSWLFD